MVGIRLHKVVEAHFGETAGRFVKELTSGRLGSDGIEISSAEQDLKVSRINFVDAEVFHIRKGCACARFTDGEEPSFFMLNEGGLGAKDPETTKDLGADKAYIGHAPKVPETTVEDSQKKGEER